MENTIKKVSFDEIVIIFNIPSIYDENNKEECFYSKQELKILREEVHLLEKPVKYVEITNIDTGERVICSFDEFNKKREYLQEIFEIIE